MALVCAGCGLYVQPQVAVADQTITCPVCGHIEPMRILPLFVVTGASGVGKTAIVPPLHRCLTQ
jgi:DNA-directed RNA polymerase subunit RPC12/RpoP